MIYENYAWFCQYLALSIISAAVLCKLALWLWRQYKLTMNEDYKSSSVDPHDLGVKTLDSTQVTSQCRVTVELIKGKCYVENGDENLNAKCNAVLAEMSDFQREFLMIAPDGKPNKMVFNEIVKRDQDGTVQRKAYFEPLKESARKKIWKKIKSFV